MSGSDGDWSPQRAPIRILRYRWRNQPGRKDSTPGAVPTAANCCSSPPKICPPPIRTPYNRRSPPPCQILRQWRDASAAAGPPSGPAGLPPAALLRTRPAPRLPRRGRRLSFRTLPPPPREPDQAPTGEEDGRPELDLWGSQDPPLQPMQLKE